MSTGDFWFGLATGDLASTARYGIYLLGGQTVQTIVKVQETCFLKDPGGHLLCLLFVGRRDRFVAFPQVLK